jgi:hypothetical protein
MSKRFGQKRVPDCECTERFTCGKCLNAAGPTRSDGASVDNTSRVTHSQCSCTTLEHEASCPWSCSWLRDLES